MKKISFLWLKGLLWRFKIWLVERKLPKVICENCKTKFAFYNEIILLRNKKDEVNSVWLCDVCKAELMDLIFEYAWERGGSLEEEISELYEKYLNNTIGEYIASFNSKKGGMANDITRNSESD